VAATKYILGIRPNYHGLQIKPCIPSDWDSYQVRRELRGAVYLINVRREPTLPANTIQIHVDGEEVIGEYVPYFGDSETHFVEVRIN